MNFQNIVDALWEDTLELLGSRVDRLGRHRLPSRAALVEAVDQLRAAFFPGYFNAADVRQDAGPFYVGALLDRALQILEEQIFRVTIYACGCDNLETAENQAKDAVQAFAETLPRIRRLLAKDVQAAYDGDPAATSLDEAIYCYPGVNALMHHRLAHELYRLDIPLIPRIISEHAHSLTGIDIHPGARIGESLFIDHGTGVVIGETSIIGDRVRIYQGVTLGAKSFPVQENGTLVKGLERHPIVEDEVVIYAGATILGRVTIGKGSSVGGNVWLTRSVPPNSRILQAQTRHDSFSHGAGI